MAKKSLPKSGSVESRKPTPYPIKLNQNKTKFIKKNGKKSVSNGASPSRNSTPSRSQNNAESSGSSIKTDSDIEIM